MLQIARNEPLWPQLGVMQLQDELAHVPKEYSAGAACDISNWEPASKFK